MHSWDESALISSAPMPVMPAPTMPSESPSPTMPLASQFFTSAQAPLENSSLWTLSLRDAVRALLPRALQIDLKQVRSLFEKRVIGYQTGGVLSRD